MKISISVMLLVLGVEMAYTQPNTRLYLNPSLGVQWGFSQFEDRENTPSYIKSANLVSGARYGIGLMVDFNEKWGLELGYGGADFGLGVKYASKTDSVESEVSGRKIRYTTVHRAYLQIFSPGKLVFIRKRRGAYLRRYAKEKKEYDFLSVFNLGFLGGISYEFVSRFSNTNASENASDVNTYDDIKLFETAIQTPEQNGLGIYFGLYTQFLNKGEKRLQLGLIYQQGLQKRIISNWATSINGIQQPDFQTFTRGSYLAFYASYPIKLLTFGEKKSKKL